MKELPRKFSFDLHLDVPMAAEPHKHKQYLNHHIVCGHHNHKKAA